MHKLCVCLQFNYFASNISCITVDGLADNVTKTMCMLPLGINHPVVILDGQIASKNDTAVWGIISGLFQHD